MKKTIVILFLLSLIISGCAPNFSSEEEVIQEPTEDEGEEQRFIIPQSLTDEEYRTMLPYEVNAARGVITNQLSNRYDIEELETGLIRHATQVFDPEDFFFQEGQYLNRNTLLTWIDDLNPVKASQALDDVNEIAKQTGLDLVQLHGMESPGYCDMIDLPVIKVFHIREGMRADELADEISNYKEVADYFLFDNKSDHRWGGTGQTFDWTILKELSLQKIPFFLSGGLNLGNVEEAIGRVQPDAIDVASGLEESPGVKDYEKTELFFDKMREIWEKQEEGVL